MIQVAAGFQVPEPLWEATVGIHGSRVWVGEREIGSPVSVRFTWGGKTVWRSLGFAVRDDRLRLQKRKQKEAVELAKVRFAEPLREGKNPLEPEEDPARPYTLREGLTKAFSLSGGMYVADSQHRRDMRRAEQPLLHALGPRFSLADMAPAKARTVWRHFLEEALLEDEPSGWRKAEKAVQLLFHLTRWLHEEDPRRAPDVRPLGGWKTKLREDFETGFQRRLEDPKRLRHSHQEAARLFGRLDEADPRLALVIMLGAELRPGQVIRSMRSQLDLSEVGGFELGKLEVLGRGKKRGEIVHLDPEMRAHVDRCLGEGGHLFELESAYQRGVIDDYYLFQKGKLRRGQIPLDRHRDDPGPVDLGSMIDVFRSFEAACSVEHMPGRSFYGLRRALTDAAPHYTSDSRELDRISGHEDSGTREKIYQDRFREEYREGAAEARRAMRLDLTAGRKPPRRRRPGPQDVTDLLRGALERVLGIEVTIAQAEAIAREIGVSAERPGMLHEGGAGDA